MPFTSEDLAFVIEVSADADDARKSLEEIGAQIDRNVELLTKGMNEALKQGVGTTEDQLRTLKEISDLQKNRQAIAGALQPPAPPAPPGQAITPGMEALGNLFQGNERKEWALEVLRAEGKHTDLLKEQVALEKQLTDEQRRRQLIEIQQGLDPVHLRDRLAFEREVARLRHAQFMEESRAALEPGALHERVRQEREVAEMRKQQEEALGKERREQARPGFFQQLFQQPGAALGAARENLGKMLGNVKEEYSKGGVGSVMDALLQRGGGGGGAGAGGAGTTNQLLGGVLGGQGGGGTLGQIGGMIGEALGGPVGAEVGKMIAEAIPKTLAAPAKLVAGGLALVGDSLRGLQGVLGPIGVGFDLLSAGAKGFTDVVKSIPIIGDLWGPMLEALSAIPGIFKDITETLVSFAAKASPGAFKLFQFAVEDVQGVIGRTFIPVLNMMRDAVRLVGDALATILPDTSETAAALTPLREAFAGLNRDLRELLADVGPLLRDFLIVNLRLLATGLAMVAWHVDILARGLRLLLLPLTETARFLGLATGEARTSVGAAARPAQISGIEEYRQQLRLAAFSAGVGGLDVPHQQLGTLHNIAILLRSIDKAVNGVLKVTPFTVAKGIHQENVQAARSAWNWVRYHIFGQQTIQEAPERG